INELTVLENVMLKGYIAKIDKELCEHVAYTLLYEIGLKEKALSFPQVLSGGQQQRVAIARALFNKPRFLLADEPTGNLDDKTAHELIELLLVYQKNYDMGLIISSHDTCVVNKMETILQLHDGCLLQNNKELNYDKRVNLSSTL